MGTTITIRVTASNTDGDGEPSDEIEVSFVEKPDTPTDFEEDTSALTDDSFTVTWVESANSDKTGEITYTITDDAGVEVTTTETSYVTEAADQGQDYTYTLTAKNVNDFESDATDEITIKFVGQPGQPIVSFTNDCAGSVTIDWTLTDDSFGNDDEANMSYAIILSDVSGDELVNEAALDVMTYDYTPESDDLGTEITVSVTATNSKRTSEAGTTTMTVVTKPGTITTFEESETIRTADTMTLTRDELADTDYGSDSVDNIVYYFSRNDVTDDEEITWTETELEDMELGYDYEFSIYAKNTHCKGDAKELAITFT